MRAGSPRRLRSDGQEKSIFRNAWKGAICAWLLPLAAWGQLPGAPAEAPGTEVREEIVWQVMEAGDFEIHYPDSGLEARAAEVAAWLEKARTRMEEVLEFRMKGPVRVILYRSRLQARQSSLLQDSPGELGGLTAEAKQRRIVLPLVPSQRAMQRTVEHQLVHIFMEQEHYGKTAVSRSLLEYKKSLYADWVLEGIAESLTSLKDPLAEMLVRDAALDRDLPPLSALHGIESLDPHHVLQFQAESGMAIEWIARNTPRGSTKRIFHVFDSDLPFPTARLIKRATGLTYSQVESRFLNDTSTYFRNWAVGREEAETFATRVRPSRNYYRVFEVGATWSPDGSKVAFFDDRHGYFGITLVDLETGDEDDLLSVVLRVSIDGIRAQERGLDWSPNGRHLCFVGDRLGEAFLYIKDMRGSGMRRIRLPFDDIAQPRYSPDGSKILLVGVREGKADLYVLELSNLEVARLTRTDWPESDPQWAPDGESVVFAGETGAQFDIFRMDLKTRQIERLLDTATHEITPTFRPDGSAITFASDAEGTFNLYSLDLATRKLKRHTYVTGGAFAPLWNRAGDRLAFSSYRHGRYTASLMPDREAGTPSPADDTARRVELLNATTGRFEGYRIRPYEVKIEFESILPTSAKLSDLFQHHEIDTKIDYKFQSRGYEFGLDISYKNKTWRPDIEIAANGGIDKDAGGTQSVAGLRLGVSYPIDRFTRASIEAFTRADHRDPSSRDTDERRGTEIQNGIGLGVGRSNVIKRRGDPIAGYRISLGVEILLEELGSDVTRVNWNGQFRTYFEVFEDHVIAIRVRGTKSNGHDEERLDLSDTVRGYSSGESRGTDLIAATLEYRFPIWRDLNLVLPGQLALIKDLRAFVFVDGAVLSEEENLLNMLLYPVREELHHSAGFGIRLDTWILEEKFIPVILTIAKVTDNTVDAPTGLSYEITFDIEF